MVQNWSRVVGNTLGYIGIALFVISILGMVFTLPRSNYLEWSPVEKKTFFRSVLTPMTIVFVLILITLVFPGAYFRILDRRPPGLGITYNIELFDLKGIPEL